MIARRRPEGPNGGRYTLTAQFRLGSGIEYDDLFDEAQITVVGKTVDAGAAVCR